MARNSGKEAYLEQRPLAQPGGWISVRAAMFWLVILFCLTIWTTIILAFVF